MNNNNNNMKEIISQIKLAVSLVDTVGEHVRLEKVGRSYRGNCPFHDEKTGSFFVNETKGQWKCFGCGKGGDIINFFADINGYKNSQAIKILSNKLGLNNTGKYKRQIDALAKQRALSEMNQIKFNNALQKLINTLENIIKILKWVTSNFTTPEEIEKYGELYHEISYLNYLSERASEIDSSHSENEMYIILKETYFMYKPLLLEFYRKE